MSHSPLISFVDEATAGISVRVGRPQAICNAAPTCSSSDILISKERGGKYSIPFCSPLYNSHGENAAYPLG